MCDVLSLSTASPSPSPQPAELIAAPCENNYCSSLASRVLYGAIINVYTSHRSFKRSRCAFLSERVNNNVAANNVAEATLYPFFLSFFLSLCISAKCNPLSRTFFEKIIIYLSLASIDNTFYSPSYCRLLKLTSGRKYLLYLLCLS